MSNEKEKLFPDEYDFMLERLVQILENSAYKPLDKYNLHTFKKCDVKKLLTTEDLNKVANVFNQLRAHYLDQAQSEITKFVDKYNFKEKLRFKSEVTFYELLLQELNITVNNLEELDELNKIQNYETHLMKYFLMQYTKDKNRNLQEENKKLREELDDLKKKNNLNLN